VIDERVTQQDDGNAEAELRAALESCALGNRGDLLRLRGDGPDLLGLLQRLRLLTILAVGAVCYDVMRRVGLLRRANDS